MLAVVGEYQLFIEDQALEIILAARFIYRIHSGLMIKRYPHLVLSAISMKNGQLIFKHDKENVQKIIKGKTPIASRLETRFDCRGEDINFVSGV
jgi:hypothetical protein